MTASMPAILGGPPAFPDGLPLVRPHLPDHPGLARRLERVLDSGKLTNGPTVRELEDAVAARLGVRHAVAVSSCTAGLMLVLRELAPAGRVVMPSFTFSASAHAVVWAGGTPDFADVEAEHATLDPAASAMLVDGAVAMTATHVYGSPCRVEELQRVADGAGIPVIYDAAHALGSVRAGTPVGGFGAAEVFSLSPTKVVVAAEGGVVTTNDGTLAEACRLGRDYGNPGDYNCRFPGLNARLSELHATVALASLAVLDDAVSHRGSLVERFATAITGVDGVRLVGPDPADVSTFKDLTIEVDPLRFGLSARQLARGLAAEGIDSRRYYDPPIHRQAAYAGRWATPRDLPVTEQLAAGVLSPPLWSTMTPTQVDGLAAAVVRLHQHRAEVRRAIEAQAPVR